MKKLAGVAFVNDEEVPPSCLHLLAASRAAHMRSASKPLLEQLAVLGGQQVCAPSLPASSRCCPRTFMLGCHVLCTRFFLTLDELAVTKDKQVQPLLCLPSCPAAAGC